MWSAAATNRADAAALVVEDQSAPRFTTGLTPPFETSFIILFVDRRDVLKPVGVIKLAVVEKLVVPRPESEIGLKTLISIATPVTQVRYWFGDRRARALRQGTGSHH